MYLPMRKLPLFITILLAACTLCILPSAAPEAPVLRQGVVALLQSGDLSQSPVTTRLR